MLILPQTVKVKWERRNKPHYVKLGYIFTKIGDELEVDVLHLTPNSNIYINLQCDYCNKIFKRTMSQHTKAMKREFISDKIACGNCKYPKLEEVMLAKYGVTNSMYREESKHILIETNMKKYGTKMPSQSQEIKDKVMATNLERYGVPWVALDPEIRQKQIETNIERYGSPCPMSDIDVREKARQSMYKNGSAPLSKQQEHIHSLVGGELNYPIYNMSVDILLDNKIVIEYDGGGHELQIKYGNVTDEEFKTKEMNRWRFLKRRGYKMIRIISKRDYLPIDNDVIIQMIEYAKEYLKSEHSWMTFDLDQKTVKCAEYEINYDFREMKRTS